MDMHEIAGTLAEIRAQIAQATVFRGFRSLTVGFSGFLALLAAWVQVDGIPRPTEQLRDYVNLWTGVAIVSLFVIGAELVYLWIATVSPLGQRLTLIAIRKFIPSLTAGTAITLSITKFSPECGWMLPGLWSIVFSQGIFASGNILPPASFWVGVHYLASGTLCLMLGNGAHALSPWLMASTFGVGQIMAALVLYFALERNQESTHGC